jgi:Flp pilus assembly pilin Flp
VLTYLAATLSYLRTRLGGERVREAGVTAVEYALMVAIIALLMVAGFFFLFNNVSTAFTDTGDCVGTPGGPGCPASTVAP